MPTPTYNLIATTTLLGNTDQVVFGSLPQTYRDLILVFNGTTQVADGVGSRYNGDSGTNYSAVRMSGLSSGAASDSFSGFTRIIETAGDTSGRTVYISNIMDYSATDKHTTVITRSSIASNVTGIASRWANTAAVTSITVFSPSSAISGGSTISIYGVIS